MSIRNILTFPLTVGVLVVAAACAPRQAVVESEPGRATPEPADEQVLATLRSDLRMLAGEQEEFAAENGYYAARLVDLGFTPSSGVRLSIIQGDRNGWSATAASGDAECAMYAGDVRSPRGYLTEQGRVACR